MRASSTGRRLRPDALAGAPVAYVYGTVTAVSPLSVMLDTESTSVVTAAVADYFPVASDRVLVLVQGADRIVVASALATSATRRGSGAGAPAGTGSNGDEYWDLTNKRLYRSDGTRWFFVTGPLAEMVSTGQIVVVGAALIATAGGAFVDWWTFPNVTIPPWATRAQINISINYIANITAATNVYVLRVIMANGTGTGIPCSDSGALAVRFGNSWNEVISFTNTGSQVFKLQAARAAGGGQWQADTAGTQFSYTINWLP